MNAAVRRGIVAGLLVFSSACSASGPASPTVTTQPAAPLPTPLQAPLPSGTFPPLSGASRTFTFEHELSYRVSDYTKRSQFVLYDNGAFVLQYAGLGEYRGGYTSANGVIDFKWEGWSTAGPWSATGTLTGDSLTI